MVHIVIGSQWGDEGKGKLVDLFGQKADYCIRFNGGNNAGHTVVNQYGSFPLHLIPSGIFNERTTAVISGSVVLNLSVLLSEIELLGKQFPRLIKRLIISPRCHVIMPYHIVLDRLYEEAKGKAKTGTTGRGIGPVYADKVSYQGIRLYDLFSAGVFSRKLKLQLRIKNAVIKSLGGSPLSFSAVYREKIAEFSRLKCYIREPYSLLRDAVSKDEYLLFEGAQGVFLDNSWGTYPYVTASSVLSSEACVSSGISPSAINRITGVVKAYTTRVGEGPFPTELKGKVGEQLRRNGREFGTTTGRPRRCGWFDAELVRFAARLNGFTDLAVTKLDVLDRFKTVKICTGYYSGKKRVNYADGDAAFLSRVQPEYLEMKGWNQPTAGCTNYESLPDPAKRYLGRIEKLTGVPVKLISVGPDRKQTIML